MFLQSPSAVVCDVIQIQHLLMLNAWWTNSGLDYFDYIQIQHLLMLNESKTGRYSTKCQFKYNTC